jgi:hypothetical protein
MSNSGQGPSLAIRTIPSNLARFLCLASLADTRVAWQRLVARSWRDPWREEGEENEEAVLDSPPTRGSG